MTPSAYADDKIIYTVYKLSVGLLFFTFLYSLYKKINEY